MNTARRIVQKHIGRELYNPVNLYLFYPEYKFECQVLEVVHHINGNRKDNRPENLYVFRDSSKHSEYHRKVKNWTYGLMGTTKDDKLVYLETLPELKSNLDQLKKWNDEGSTIGRYFDD